MNYLYSLYDALVSISVPSDKARAVVDAMERDMGTTLATKQDLSLFATREDLLALKQDVAILRRDMESRFTLVEQKIDSLRYDVSRDLAALDLKMTVKLGSMLFVGFGLTIAALRLWN
jgi:hypothetical protein